MTKTTPEAISPLRAALLGLAAGAGAALLAEGLGFLVSTLLVAVQSYEVVGANIGAGLAAGAVTLLIAPALALLLLRLTRVPRPLAVVLYSLPLYLVLSVAASSGAIVLETWLWDRFPDLADLTSPWVPWYLLTLVSLPLPVALAALLTTRSRGTRDTAGV